jgi:hypothetical protein
MLRRCRCGLTVAPNDVRVTDRGAPWGDRIATYRCRCGHSFTIHSVGWVVAALVSGTLTLAGAGWMYFFWVRDLPSGFERAVKLPLLVGALGLAIFSWGVSMVLALRRHPRVDEPPTP